VLTTIVNKSCLVVNFATKDGLFMSSKLWIKPLARISFCIVMDLTIWMSIVFGTISYIKGLERTFAITHLLDSRLQGILKNGG
jgi:hypothetical protein